MVSLGADRVSYRVHCGIPRDICAGIGAFGFLPADKWKTFHFGRETGETAAEDVRNE
jgi:hypothetical protein